MKIRCLICGDTIESKSVHNLVTCKCESCYIDGGNEYLRFGEKDFSKILIILDDDTEVLASDEKIIKRNIKNGKIKNINLLYVILVFIISTIIIKIDSTLWINVFEVMITAYFTIIYEEMKSMKIFSHGVSSGICVETNVIISRYNTKNI